MVRPAPMRCPEAAPLAESLERGLPPMGMQDPRRTGAAPSKDSVECAKRHFPGPCGMLHLRR